MSELLLVISVICNLNTPGIIMPKEEKILCIEEMTNCLVGPDSTYRRNERKNCERKYENNKANRGKND